MESANPHLIHFIWVSASPPGADLLRQPGPVSSILMALLILALAAMLGGRLIAAIKQPAVLGELLAGLLIGNPASRSACRSDCLNPGQFQRIGLRRRKLIRRPALTRCNPCFAVPGGSRNEHPRNQAWREDGILRGICRHRFAYGARPHHRGEVGLIFAGSANASASLTTACSPPSSSCR
jgi:hypothetical protein